MGYIASIEKGDLEFEDAGLDSDSDSDSADSAENIRFFFSSNKYMLKGRIEMNENRRRAGGVGDPPR
jgi:hypothetical protein